MNAAVEKSCSLLRKHLDAIDELDRLQDERRTAFEKEKRKAIALSEKLYLEFEAMRVRHETTGTSDEKAEETLEFFKLFEDLDRLLNTFAGKVKEGRKKAVEYLASIYKFKLKEAVA